ncbi:MAG: hypothetical protein CMF26_02205 [Kiloniella sp.]|nr:hypothetical protein [Kiloniella sp.]
MTKPDSNPPPGGNRSLLKAIRADIDLHLRSGLYLIGFVVSALLALPLALLVPSSRLASAIPAFILICLGSATMLFMAARIVRERDDGMLDAVLGTPLSANNFIAAKLVSLNLLMVFMTVVMLSLLQAGIALQGGEGPLFSLLDFGFGLIGLMTLFLLVALGLIVRFRRLTDFLLPALLLSFFIQMPVLLVLDVFEHWALLVIPSASPTLIMMGAFGTVDPLLASMGYLGTALWLVILFVWSKRAFYHYLVNDTE